MSYNVPMNERTCRDLYALANAMENDPRYRELEELDRLLNSDPEVQGLSTKAKKAAEDFDEALRLYGEDSKEAKEAQHLLYIAKKELDEHPLSRRYYAAYSVIRHRDGAIESILLTPFRSQIACGGKHA